MWTFVPLYWTNPFSQPFLFRSAMQSCLQLWPSPALRCAAKQCRCASGVQWRSVGGCGQWAVSWPIAGLRCGGWIYQEGSMECRYARVFPVGSMIHFFPLSSQIADFGKFGRGWSTQLPWEFHHLAEVVGNGHHQREAAGFEKPGARGLHLVTCGFWAWPKWKCPKLELPQFSLKRLIFLCDTNRFWKNLGLDSPHLCAFPTHVWQMPFPCKAGFIRDGPARSCKVYSTVATLICYDSCKSLSVLWLGFSRRRWSQESRNALDDHNHDCLFMKCAWIWKLNPFFGWSSGLPYCPRSFDRWHQDGSVMPHVNFILPITLLTPICLLSQMARS